jgi:hypothetical protein
MNLTNNIVLATTTVLALSAPVLAQSIPGFPINQGKTIQLDPKAKAVVRVVPASGSGKNPVDFCRRSSSGLVVRLENIGTVPAPPEAVTASFPNQSRGTSSSTLQSSTLQPGRTSDLVFKIPHDVFMREFDFTIKRSNQPAIIGHCIG